jgi:poly(A) polymerase
MDETATRRLVSALTANRATVRFCGGCVRDAVGGRPVTDVDLATADPPTTVIQLLRSAGLTAIPTGVEHGTVTAISEHRPFEVTTLRRDVETFGRHARVAFTDDWLADAARRDFTINALYADPDGTLYDPFGGREDLRLGRVRFVGSAADRIREDVLRILRFFRFQARFGSGEPDAEAMAAIAELSPSIPTLSGERLRHELKRILVGPRPVATIELMAATGALQRILPAVDVFDRLSRLIAIEPRPDAIRRLAAILSRDAPSDTVAEHLRLSRAERERLKSLVDPAAILDPAASPSQRRRLLFAHGPNAIVDWSLLAWAERPRSEDEERGYRQWIEAAEHWIRPRLPVTGDDAQRFGLRPGPCLGKALADVEAWWIAGDFKAGREACLERLRLAAAD